MDVREAVSGSPLAISRHSSVKRWAVCVNGEVQFTTAPSAEAAKAYIKARMLKLFGRANITDVQLINDNK